MNRKKAVKKSGSKKLSRGKKIKDVKTLSVLPTSTIFMKDALPAVQDPTITYWKY